jgi:hypothetical protein
MSSKPLRAPGRAVDCGAAGRSCTVSVIGCIPTHEDDALAGWAIGANRTAQARRAFVCALQLLPSFPRPSAACEMTA